MAILKGLVHDGYLQINRKVRFMQDVQELADNLIGDTYYVRPTTGKGSDSKDGLSPDNAFLTPYKALAVAGDFDKILVFPPETSTQMAILIETVQGTDDAYCPLCITQQGLKFIGLQKHWFTYGAPTIHTHVNSQSILHVGKVGGLCDVEIAGFTFQQQGTGAFAIMIGVGGTTTRTVIHHCNFSGYGTTTSGVGWGNAVGGACDSDAPYTLIDQCHFMGFTSQAIYFSGVDGSGVMNCVFDKIPAAGSGIVNTMALAGITLPQFILNCKFVGISATDSAAGSTGISIGTADTEGELYVDGCSFMNFGASRAITRLDAGVCGVNYLNGVLLTYS